MVFDRAYGHNQFLGDSLVGGSTREQAKHLEFAFA